MTFPTGRGMVRIFFGAVLLGPLAAPAAAQVIDSPYRFIDRTQSGGPFGGYVAAGRGAIGLGPESGPVFGGRYAIRLSGPLTIEGEAGYFRSTRTVMDTIPADTTLRSIGQADLNLVLARAALRFNITGARTWHGLQPFLAFGGGLAVDAGGDAAVEEDLPQDVRFDYGTSFAGDVGAGIEWFLSPGVTIRLDGRNLLWRLRTPDAFLLGGRGQNLPDREWAQNFFMSAGLSVHF